MKRLVTFCLLALGYFAIGDARSANTPVIFSTDQLFGQPLTNALVTYQPLSLITQSNRIVVLVPYTNRTDWLGNFTNSTAPGNYRVTIEDPRIDSIFTNCIPENGGAAVFASDYICAARPTNGVSFSTVQSDNRYALKTNGFAVGLKLQNTNAFNTNGIAQVWTATSTSGDGAWSNITAAATDLSVTNALVTTNALAVATNAIRADILNLQGGTNGLNSAFASANATNASQAAALTTISNLVNDAGRNVKEFGAKGDGVTDDTAAIQSAIAANITLLFPAGTNVYSVTTLYPSNNCSFFGWGGGRPTLKEPNGNSNFMFFGGAANNGGSQATNCWFRDLTLVGATVQDYSTTATATNQSGIQIYRGAVIENCTLIGFNKNAIDLHDNLGTSQRDIKHAVRFCNNVSNYCGVYVGDEYTQVDDNAMGWNYFGINCTAGNMNASGNKINDCGRGAWLNGSGNNGHGSLNGNTINHCDRAVWCDGLAYGYNISGNMIWGGADCLVISNSYGVLFEGNHVGGASNIKLSGGTASGTNYAIGNYFEAVPTLTANFGGSTGGLVFIDNVSTNLGSYITSSSRFGTNIFTGPVTISGTLTVNTGWGIALGGSAATSGNVTVADGNYFLFNGLGGIGINGNGRVEVLTSSAALGQLHAATVELGSSVAAPAAPLAQGSVYWTDGTNTCVVHRNAAGALTTNKVTEAVWP